MVRYGWEPARAYPTDPMFTRWFALLQREKIEGEPLPRDAPIAEVKANPARIPASVRRHGLNYLGEIIFTGVKDPAANAFMQRMNEVQGHAYLFIVAVDEYAVAAAAGNILEGARTLQKRVKDVESRIDSF